MATISTALRNFKEPTKEHLTQTFFSIPPVPPMVGAKVNPQEEVEKMDINAVLSLGVAGEEDSYVCHFCLSIQMSPRLLRAIVALVRGDCYDVVRARRIAFRGRRCTRVLMLDVGRKTVYRATLPQLRLIGPQVGPFHHTSLHHPACRAPECTCWNICTQPVHMARYENREFSPLKKPFFLVVFRMNAQSSRSSNSPRSDPPPISSARYSAMPSKSSFKKAR